MVREENRIRREARALLRKAKDILSHEGKNGGAKDLELLTTLAVKEDVRGFRSAFDNCFERFSPELYTTISGISQVKTEIIHTIMDELAEGKEGGATETLTGAVTSVSSEPVETLS